MALRVVAGDRVVREPPHVAVARRVLERPDADVARRDARQHGAGQRRRRAARARRWPRPPAPARSGSRARASPRRSRTRAASGRPRPCRRRRARTASARSPSGAGRAAGRGVEHLAEQQRPSVAEPRRVRPELVPRVDLRDRRRALGRDAAGQHRGVSAASTPSSAASGSLNASIRGAGASAPCHGTYRPSSSRTNVLSKANSEPVSTAMTIEATTRSDPIAQVVRNPYNC